MVSRISHSMESGRSEDLRAVAIRPEKRISIYWTKVSMHALGGEAASGRWTPGGRGEKPPSAFFRAYLTISSEGSAGST
jgi:hypothetical protein